MIFFKKKENSFNFPKIVKINDFDYNIKVGFYSKRSSSVSIKKDILEFRLSKYLLKKDIEDHFNSLLDSISKKIIKSPKSSFFSFSKILEKKYFEFAGNTYHIIYHNKRITKLKENTFYVDQNLSEEIIEKKLTNILIKHFTPNLINYVNYINSISYNYNIKGVKIKVLNSKWGHCTHDNEILINLRLLNAPKEVLDYVIYHELSHVIEKNHSKSFWNLVSKYCPNYKELRNYLKQNPPFLFK